MNKVLCDCCGKEIDIAHYEPYTEFEGCEITYYGKDEDRDFYKDDIKYVDTHLCSECMVNGTLSVEQLKKDISEKDKIIEGQKTRILELEVEVMKNLKNDQKDKTIEWQKTRIYELEVEVATLRGQIEGLKGQYDKAVNDRDEALDKAIAQVTSLTDMRDRLKEENKRQHDIIISQKDELKEAYEKNYDLVAELNELKKQTPAECRMWKQNFKDLMDELEYVIDGYREVAHNAKENDTK